MSNIPNILSNQLDQAPKTKEAGYQNRIEELSQEIEEALDQNCLIGDDNIENRIKENQHKLPVKMLNTLNDGETLSLEIKREKIAEKSGGRNEALSAPMGPENSLFLNAKHKLSKNKNPLQAGEKGLYLLITKEKDPEFPKNQNFKIKAVEFSLPGETALLPKGFVFEKELEGEEFENAVKDVNLN